MKDRVFEQFLSQQEAAGLGLAAASDILELRQLAPSPAHTFRADFHAKTLVRTDMGEIQSVNGFSVAVRFPADFRRRVVEPAEVVMWLGPQNVFHPNIHGPFLCLGRLTPATTLVEILYQAYEIATFQRVQMREDDALNRAACSWARRHKDWFPVDRRPLKRRVMRLRTTPAIGAKPERSTNEADGGVRDGGVRQ